MNDTFVQLSNERLTVKIAKPGTVYTGSRFDWTGFITHVVLDGSHTFAACESPVPGEGSGGIGFCNEFGLNRPIGYDEAVAGEGYLKPGIGTVLKYDNRPGDQVQMLNLKITGRAEISYRHTDTQAVFLALNPEINGYKSELHKHISLCDNSLSVTYNFINTGRKRICTDEYMHNFMCIDSHCTGPDYRIFTAAKPDNRMLELSRRLQPEILFERDYISFSKEFDRKAFYIKCAEVIPETEYSWKIYEKKSGCSVCETDSFVPACIAVWGTKYTVAPESFVNIDLAPGEACSWTRTLKFESDRSDTHDCI